VVRLTGTNEAEACAILKGIGMTALSDMDEAVQQVVRAAKGAA
jgi:succinyl-CoA synthetase beta subunit